jgi:hypothetical protein
MILNNNLREHSCVDFRLGSPEFNEHLWYNFDATKARRGGESVAITEPAPLYLPRFSHGAVPRVGVVQVTGLYWGRGTGGTSRLMAPFPHGPKNPCHCLPFDRLAGYRGGCRKRREYPGA